MTTGNYKEPDWAVKSSVESWILTEIKRGVEITKHPVYTRSTTIIGRAVDQVHISLQHESISRQHARISFDSMGQPWLRDLQSAHGSFVNKRKLPQESIGKVESNSLQKGARGVKLSVGNILTFGASTRYFLLEGPQSEKDPNKIKLQLKQNESSQLTTGTNLSLSSPETQEKLLTSNILQKEEGVSWGISMIDDDADSDNGNYVNDSMKTIPMDLNVPEKYRKELEKLNVLKNKLVNLETESGRIRRKGELTEGQEKQLQRNVERESILKISIREKEESLYDRINGKKEKNSRHEKRKMMMEYKNSLKEGDDDYFDRTKTSKNGNKRSSEIITETESEETLTQKWNKIVEEQKHLRGTALYQGNNRVTTLNSRLKQMQASGDEEAFFVENDLQLAKETKNKIESLLADGHTTIDEIEKLLKIVNPNIYCDRKTGYIGEGQPSTSSSAQDKNDDLSLPSFPSLPNQANSSTEIPVCTNKNIEPMRNDHDASTDSTADYIMPPPKKRKRFLGPTKSPPSLSTSSTKESKLSSQKPAATLSFLNPISKVNTLKDKTSSTKFGKHASNASRRCIDLKKDEWMAPKGQDGSGRTKLNEKFAGRY
mmetsp:Transcript_49094/g.53002  ORF Transcript_49094/g.53002 Transcript_49094/m.53002 type:complete len:600 (-) Transcript_49094:1996-3795(-)